MCTAWWNSAYCLVWWNSYTNSKRNLNLKPTKENQKPLKEDEEELKVLIFEILGDREALAKDLPMQNLLQLTEDMENLEIAMSYTKKIDK